MDGEALEEAALMRVSFTPAEYRLAVDAAIAVSENKAVLNASGEVVNRRLDLKRSDFEVNLIGALGEVAVCTALGVPFQMTVKQFGDDGSDLEFNGYSLQVKTISNLYAKSHLVVRDMTKTNADVFVACALAGPATVEILGAISRTKFLREAVDKDLGYGPMPSIDTRLLTDIDSAKMILKTPPAAPVCQQCRVRPAEHKVLTVKGNAYRWKCDSCFKRLGNSGFEGKYA